jgi:hypothetical protein
VDEVKVRESDVPRRAIHKPHPVVLPDTQDTSLEVRTKPALGGLMSK